MKRLASFFGNLLVFCSDLVIVVAEGVIVFMAVVVDFLDTHIGGN